MRQYNYLEAPDYVHKPAGVVAGCQAPREGAGVPSPRPPGQEHTAAAAAVGHMCPDPAEEPRLNRVVPFGSWGCRPQGVSKQEGSADTVRGGPTQRGNARNPGEEERAVVDMLIQTYKDPNSNNAPQHLFPQTQRRWDVPFSSTVPYRTSNLSIESSRAAAATSSVTSYKRTHDVTFDLWTRGPVSS